MDYPDNIIYTSEDTCCTTPPNPWIQPPPFVPQGCQCDTNCVNQFGPNPVLFHPGANATQLPASSLASILDTKAAAFAADASNVTAIQNASLLIPASTSATIAAIPAQNAAAIVNANNKSTALSHQAIAVTAASNSTLCISASRLAIVMLTDATAAYNVINTNTEDFAVLVNNIKLDSDALIIASTAAKNAATTLYMNAQDTLTEALQNVTTKETAAAQARLDATTALCNCVKGSGAYTLQLRNNNINVTTANYAAELASTTANSLMQSVNGIQAVSESTTTALIHANTAAAAIQTVNTLYQNALAAKAAYNLAILTLYDASGNLNPAATTTLVAMNAAYALLLPSTQMSDIVTKCMTASRSANLAAANARALSGVLGAAAKAAAAPSQRIVTAQNIATQTAAAERFGAAAAAAAARLARLSGAPPIPPPIPVPNLTEYRARIPSYL